MALIHTSSTEKYDYHYFSTDQLVTVQIGRSTNVGKYIWSIFHPDIKCAIWGGETNSLESAKDEAEQWILQWVEPKQTT